MFLATGVAAAWFACLHAWLRMVPIAAQNSDVTGSYLPAARAFREAGFAMMAHWKSLEISPFSYVYLSLFLDHPEFAQYLHCAFFGLCVWLFYRIGERIHSPAAGAVAAWLLASQPSLGSLFSTLLSEPLFFTLLSVSLWATVEVVAGGRRRLIAVAGVAFGLGLITRGVFIYGFYAALLLLPLLARGARGMSRRLPEKFPVERTLGCSRNLLELWRICLFALPFPLVVLVKNLILFGFFGLYSGAGAQLYYGSHPLTGGIDPNWILGLWMDVPLTSSPSYIPPLSPLGDLVYGEIGREMIRDLGLLPWLGMLLHKALAFVFAVNGNMGSNPSNPLPWVDVRTLRVVEAGLAVAGLWAVRSRRAVALFALGAVYVVAVHAPALLVYRYSVLLVFFLIPLSAAGAVWTATRLAASSTRQRTVAWGVCLTVALGVAAGKWHYAHALNTPIHVSRGHLREAAVVPPETLRALSGERWRAVSTVPGAAAVSATYFAADARPVLLVPITGAELSGLLLQGRVLAVTSIRMAIAAPHGADCRSATLSFRPAGSDTGWSPGQRFRIRADGRERWYHVGSYPLKLARAGLFRLTFDCPAGTRVTPGDFRVLEDFTAATYGRRVLQRLEAEGKLQAMMVTGEPLLRVPPPLFRSAPFPPARTENRPAARQ